MMYGNKFKKAYSTKVFILVLGLFIAALLLIFLYKWSTDLGSRQRNAQILDLKQKLRHEVETVQFGQVKKVTYQVPIGTEVCFFDAAREKRLDIISHEYSIFQDYPTVREIINPNEGIDRNIVYIDLNTHDITSQWEPSLCFNDPPYFTCQESEDGTIELIFEGLGNCVTIWSRWRDMAGDNKKEESLYASDTMFLSWDEDDTHTNWENILPTIPLSIWQDDYGVVMYDFTIFHNNELITIDNDLVIDMLERKNNKIGYILGLSPITPDGQIEDTEYYLHGIDLIAGDYNYFLFWEIHEDTIITDFSADAPVFKAAVGAASLNAPVVYLDSTNYDQFDIAIEDKRVWIFDNQTIDDEVFERIYDKASYILYVNSENWEVSDFFEEEDVIDSLSHFLLQSRMDKVE